MNRSAILHDDDIVVFTAATTHAVHAGILQVYERAKTKVAANGPAWTDDDGVVRERQYRLTFAEVRESRTERQNRFYFGPVLKQISAQAPGNWTKDAWHEAFKREILGYEIIKVRVAGRKRPTVYRRLRSTTGLSVEQMSDYIDQVLATAATDLGVIFDLDPAERQAVRHRKPSRKRKTEAAAA